MEEELIINVKIQGDPQSAKNIQDLIDRNKELKTLLKNAPREGTEEFKKLNKEIAAAKQEFADNNAEIKKFNRSLKETDVAADSLKGLSRNLRKLGRRL